MSEATAHQVQGLPGEPRVTADLVKRLVGCPTVEQEGSIYVAGKDVDSDEAVVLRPLQAAVSIYRIAFDPHAGQKVLTLQGAVTRGKDFKQTLCSDIDGFSLHAAVRCGADDRQALEQALDRGPEPAER